MSDFQPVQKPNRSFYSRRSVRLRDYDYSQAGLYFVTICTFQKACLFGDIRGGELILNKLGQLVRDLWLYIPVSRANTELDAFVVMPNHLHGIIQIDDIDSEQNRANRSRAEGVFTTTLPSGSLGATIGQFKSVVTKRSRALPNLPTSPIWQRNFYEHIIRDESTLNDIRKYILDNPARWTDDNLYVD